jgi:O-antigen/teichoic acid export membrane protein
MKTRTTTDTLPIPAIGGEGESTQPDYFATARLRPDLRSRALAGVSVTLVAQTCAFVISTVGTILLARLLTPHDFGLVTMVLAFSFLLQNFGMNGFIEATIQKDDIDHRQVSTLYWINVAINLTLALLFSALAPAIAWFYNEPVLKPIALVMAISILFGGLATQHQALLRRNMQFARIAVIDVGATFASLAIAILLAFRGWGYWALVARWVAVPVTATLATWMLCRWRPGLPANAAGVAQMLRFALHTYGNFVLFYLSKTTDKILIGRFLGSQALGSYDRAYQLATMLPSQLLSPLNSVALPTFSRLADDPARYRQTFLRLLSILAFVCMPVSAVVTLTGRDLILLLLGPKWESAGDLLPFFGVSAGVILLYCTHAWLHLSLGTPDKWLRWALVAFGVTLLLFGLGLPYGPRGVAAAYSASFYLLLAPALWYAGRPVQLRVSSIVGGIWRYFAAALVAGLVCWFGMNEFEPTAVVFRQLSLLTRIAAGVVGCTVIYLALVVALYRGTQPIVEFIRLASDMIPREIFNRIPKGIVNRTLQVRPETPR